MLVNRAASVMGSVTASPPNRVECVSSVYVPVWFIGTCRTVDRLLLLSTGKNPPPPLNGDVPSQSIEGQLRKCPNTPDGTFVCIIWPAGFATNAAMLVSSLTHDILIAAELMDSSCTSK